VPKIESSLSDDKTPEITKQERLAIHTLREMPEMTYFYMEKGAPSLPESATEDIVEEKYAKVHKKERKPRNPKLSIDLNRPALEENQEEPALQEKQEEPVIGSKDVMTPEDYEAIIADLRQKNQRLVIQNSRLQTKVQKLKQKAKETLRILKENL
jgi:hypothetical protein